MYVEDLEKEEWMDDKLFPPVVKRGFMSKNDTDSFHYSIYGEDWCSEPFVDATLKLSKDKNEMYLTVKTAYTLKEVLDMFLKDVEEKEQLLKENKSG